MILFSDGETPTPAGIGKLGMEVVPVEDAAQARCLRRSAGERVAGQASEQRMDAQKRV